MKRFTQVLFFIAFAALVFAQSSIKVPAVDSSGKGILTSVEASVKPGSGAVYLDVEPFISVETQESAKLAVKIAGEQAGIDTRFYDVFFKVVANTELIDGPSGGAAFTLLAYAEFAGKQIRSDFSSTGTIEPDGSIGPIGGVLEKAYAARDNKLKVFAVPMDQGIQNGVDLTKMQGKWNMQVVEVSNIVDLIPVAFSQEGTFVNVTRRERAPLVLPVFNSSSSVEPMSEIARTQLTALRDLNKALSSKNTEEALVVSSAVDEQLNLSEYLLDNGFYYSAANLAFVTKIGVESFLLGDVSKKDFEARLDLLLSELNQSFEQKFSSVYKQKTLDNWEWVEGAEVRYLWARARASEVKEKLSLVSSPASLLEDYYSAVNWLVAVEQLSKIAGERTGGVQAMPVNEFEARDYLKTLLDQAGAAVNQSADSEAQWHYEIALNAFQDGDYLSTQIDSCFAIGFSNARKKALSSPTGKDFNSPDGSSKEFTSIWGELYYGNAVYNDVEYARTSEFGYTLNSLKLKELSTCLQESKEKLVPLLSTPVTGGGFTVENASINQLPPSAASASPQLGVQAIIQRTNGDTGGTFFDQQKNLFIIEILALIIAVSIAVVFVRSRFTSTARELTSVERLRLADDLLLKGKITERNYEYLRKKYAGTAFDMPGGYDAPEKPVVKPPVKKRGGKGK